MARLDGRKMLTGFGEVTSFKLNERGQEGRSMQNACGDKESVIILVGRPEGKRPLRRPSRRWEGNI